MSEELGELDAAVARRGHRRHRGGDGRRALRAREPVAPPEGRRRGRAPARQRQVHAPLRARREARAGGPRRLGGGGRATPRHRCPGRASRASPCRSRSSTATGTRPRAPNARPGASDAIASAPTPPLARTPEEWAEARRPRRGAPVPRAAGLPLAARPRRARRRADDRPPEGPPGAARDAGDGARHRDRGRATIGRRHAQAARAPRRRRDRGDGAHPRGQRRQERSSVSRARHRRRRRRGRGGRRRGRRGETARRPDAPRARHPVHLDAGRMRDGLRLLRERRRGAQAPPRRRTRSSAQVLVGRSRLDAERAPPQRRLHGHGRAPAQLRGDRALAPPAHAPRGHRSVGAPGHGLDERARARDRPARRRLRRATSAWRSRFTPPTTRRARA